MKILSNDLPKKIFLYKYEKNCENKINYNDVIFKFHNFSNLYEEKYDQILKKNYNHELNLGFYAKEVINGNTFKLKNTSRKYFLNIDLHPHNVIINKAEKRAFIVDHGSYSFLNPEIAIGFHLFKILRHTYYKNKTVKDSSVIKILKNYLKNINQQIDSNEVSFELGYLLNLATLEIFRRIIFILDEYFDRNCKLWESEIVMHSFALLENKFIQNKLS